MRPGEEGLSAGDYEGKQANASGLQVDAASPSGRVTVEALAAGHTPRWGGTLLLTLLSG